MFLLITAAATLILVQNSDIYPRSQNTKTGHVRVLVVPMEQSVEEMALIHRIADAKYSVNEVLSFARKLRRTTSNQQAKLALSKHISILQRMVQNKHSSKNNKNAIQILISSLKDEDEFDVLTNDPKSATAKLIAAGEMAIPFLIDEIDNDEMTRSVFWGVTTKEVIPPAHVIRIGDCACLILWRITGKSFGDTWYIHDETAKMSPKEVREQAKKWWQSQK